jgi:alginate O-acetyltransferase complex protein AlgI
LRDYLYIPLGGNRASEPRIYINLMATFLLGGLWHGASWTFVIWGALHGGAVVVHRAWRGMGLRMPKATAWLLTFLFVNVTWVFFRAKSFDDAFRVLRGMADLRSAIDLPLLAIPTHKLAWSGWLGDVLLRYLPHGLAANALCFAALTVGFIIVSRKNSLEWMMTPDSTVKLSAAVLLFCSATYLMLMTKSAVFLYFNF